MVKHLIKEKFYRHQEINAIINNSTNRILLNETKKVSAVREAPEFWDSDYNENNMYQVEKWALKRLKKNLTDVSVRLNMKVHMWLKIEMKLYIDRLAYHKS